MYIKLKKIIYYLLNILFNDILMDILINIYEKFIKQKIRNAQSKYNTKLIKHIGVNTIIKWDTTIYHPDKLILGDHIRIGEGAFLFCHGGITIGDNTQISRNVVIYSSNHNTNGNAIPYDDTYIDKPVIIGKSVWIGMNVLITPGVKIGSGSIIGMGTVVSKDILPGEIVVGQQQRIVKKRNLKNLKILEKKQYLFGKLWPNL